MLMMQQRLLLNYGHHFLIYECFDYSQENTLFIERMIICDFPIILQAEFLKTASNVADFDINGNYLTVVITLVT